MPDLTDPSGRKITRQPRVYSSNPGRQKSAQISRSRKAQAILKDMAYYGEAIPEQSWQAMYRDLLATPLYNPAGEIYLMKEGE